MMRLYDGAWDDIIEGLSLRADWLTDVGESEQAELVRELLKSLENIGKEELGGMVEGYTLSATTGGKQRMLEIQIAPDSQ